MWVLTGPEYPAVASTLIQSAYRNTLDSAIATGLSNCITKDGQQTVTANIPFGGFKITGLGLATLATDAASLANIVAGTGTYVSAVGGTAAAITLTPSPAITAYATGQIFRFFPTSTGSSAGTTVAISGLAAKSVIRYAQAGTQGGLKDSDLQIGKLAEIIYNGTTFELFSSVNSVMSAVASSLTLTGCTTSPSTNATYTISGMMVTATFGGTLNATSNTTACTITGWPAILQPAALSQTVAVPGGAFNDNTVAVSDVNMTITAGSGTLTFRKGGLSTGFTAAGNKGIASPFSFSYVLL